MKKLLLGLALSLGIFMGGVSDTHAEDYIPPPTLEGWCEGSGSTIQYNKMEWSQMWYYITSDDWISNEEVSSCINVGGCGYTNSLQLDCVLNLYNDDRLREENFITGRKCINNCDGTDPLQDWLDEAPEASQPKYNFDVSESLVAGDKIRVLVYAHNTATENLYPTDSTDVRVEWDTTLSTPTLTAKIIFSTDNGASYNTTTSLRNLILPNLGNNLTLSPSSLSVLEGDNFTYEAIEIAPNGVNFITESNAAIYKLGAHNSCFANRKFIYMDFNVVAEPAFHVVKTAVSPLETENVQPGDQITYSITVINDTAAPLTNVVVTDTLESNLVWTSGDTEFSHNNANPDIVTLTLANLAGNESISREFTVTVADPLVPANTTQVCNGLDSAIANDSNGNINGTIDGNICHQITPIEPAFHVVKTAISPLETENVQPGDTITYSITVTNDTTAPLTNVVVTDTLESNLVWSSGDTGFSHNNANPDIVTLTLANLAGNESISREFTVTVADPLVPANTTQVCNGLDSAIANDSNGNINGTINGNICHQITPIEPAFTIVKSSMTGADEMLSPNEEFTYTITVENTGNVDIADFTATDILNDDLIWISGGTYDAVTRIISVDFGTLSSGETDSREIIVKVVANPSAETVCNEASATGTVDGTELDPQSSQVCDTIIIITPPQYEITKTDSLADGAVYSTDPTEEFKYIITVTNTGTVDIPYIIATDELETRLDYVGSDFAGISYDSATRIVSIPFYDIPAGDSVSKTFIVKGNESLVSCGATLCNTVNSEITDRPIREELIGDTLSSSIKTTKDIPQKDIIDTISEGFSNAWNFIKNSAKKLFGAIFREEYGLDFSVVGVDTYLDIPDSFAEIGKFRIGNIDSQKIAIQQLTFDNQGSLNLENNIENSVLFLSGEAISTTTTTNNNSITFDINGEGFIIKPNDSAVFSIRTDLVNGNVGENIQLAIKYSNIKNKGLDSGKVVLVSDRNGGEKNILHKYTINSIDTHTDQFCRPVICTGGLELIKSASPAQGTNVQAGDTITYTITVKNNSDQVMTNIIVTDQLESNLIFDGSTDANVSENPANSGNLTLNFGDLGGFPDNEKSITFRVKVKEGATGQVCNVAEYDNNGTPLFSDEVCHPIGTGSGGPTNGGVSTNTIVPVCGGLSVNGAPQCTQQIIPDSWWKDCLDGDYSDEKKDSCELEWTEENGLVSCTENSDCVVELPDPIDVENCTTGCTMLIGEIVKNPAKTNVAVDENAEYKVTLKLTNKDENNNIITINPGGIKIHDLIVPGDSGWLNDHILNESFDKTSWTLDVVSGGLYNVFSYKKAITLSPGETKEITLTYEMDTALTIVADTAEVKNVAFASMSFTAGRTHYDARSDASLCTADLTSEDIFVEFDGNNSTYGSTATVTIDRPFVEVRTGAALGVKRTTAQNPFGGYNQGKNADRRIDLEEGLFNDFVAEQTTQIPANSTDTISKTFSFGTFTQSADGADVWTYSGNNDITLPSALGLDSPHTFIIPNNVNLKINDKFVLNKDGKNKFAAFVVDGGDIIIDSIVENIEGIFITTTGNIISGGDPAKSEVQLKISGAIMGDATDLLKNRIYIGKFIDDGTGTLVLKNGLQPSVKINYDIRLLNDTPPALEAFLGEGSAWGQDW